MLCNCDCGDACPLGKTGMEPRCNLKDIEAIMRAREAYHEAWQMALDFNQPSEVKREWEAKRDAALLELQQAHFRAIINR